MDVKRIKNWIKEWDLRPEQAAAILQISLTTLQNGLRGAVWSLETQRKVNDAMANHNSRIYGGRGDSTPASSFG